MSTGHRHVSQHAYPVSDHTRALWDSALWLPDCYTMAGRKAENQDSLLITTCLTSPLLSAQTEDSHPSIHAPLLVLMADGVSACQFPKPASQLVAETVMHHITSALTNMAQQNQTFSETKTTPQSLAQRPNDTHKALTGFDDHQVAILIKEAVHQANDALYFPQDYQRVPPLLSTLSGLLCIGDRIHLFHTGDSRIYRVGVESMTQLTKDHSIRHGRDTGALSAAIGADTYIELQQSVFTLHQHECLALMTDGVYESVAAAELQFELCAAARAFSEWRPTTHQSVNPLQISQHLCKQALSAGSHDNLSMIMLGMSAHATNTQTYNIADSAVFFAHAHGGDKTYPSDIHRYQLPVGLQIGTRIDRFIVKKIIARTARSEVYLVEDDAHHELVLKSPSLDAIADGHYLREFLKERKIGLSLSKHSHTDEPAYNQVDPNSLQCSDTHSSGAVYNHSYKNVGSARSASGLLRYYPVPASSTYLYHLTEYIDGESLRSFIDRHAPCDVWQTYDLLTKVGMAVRVMHRHYLLHQDIKPENVLLTKSGAVKLIDFGSASSLILKDSTRPPHGDLHYAAPEYYTDAPKGVHSDLFSIAVIGYELLTGTLPFSAQALMTPHHSLAVPTEPLCQNQVPAASQQALMRALHFSTQARHQAIGDFLHDFNPDNRVSMSGPEPLISRHPLLVWHSICFIQLIIIVSLLAYFL